MCIRDSLRYAPYARYTDKMLNSAVVYGSNGSTLYDNTHVPLELRCLLSLPLSPLSYNTTRALTYFQNYLLALIFGTVKIINLLTFGVI